MKGISTFFKLSGSERRGAYVLIGLILLVQLAAKLYPEKSHQQFDEADFGLFHSFLESKTETQKFIHPEVFKFNPNELDTSAWVMLGLSHKQASSVIKYRNIIGGFYSKEDLLKAYAIDSNMIVNWIDSIEWDSRPAIQIKVQEMETQNTPKFDFKHDIKQTVLVDLNLADSADLITIRGIGPATASRLLKYRKLLGGFYSTSQLQEVYGFRNENIELALPQIKLSEESIEKLCINQLSAEELSNHPYIRQSVARVIEAYRNQHGPFNKIEELLDIGVITDSTYIKIKPYVDLCQRN